MRSALHAALFPCHRCGLPVYVKHEPFGDAWMTAEGKPHINCEPATPPTKPQQRLMQPELFTDDPATTRHAFYDDREA